MSKHLTPVAVGGVEPIQKSLQSLPTKVSNHKKRGNASQRIC
jgi:hypothetical protein